MTCKNCEANLRSDFMYCPACGARTTVRRITYNTLISDIYERVLNLDNTFFRTVRDLTVRPERVIGSYIDGIRRRYVNPISYLGGALAISGISFFAMRSKMDVLAENLAQFGMSTDATRKVLEFTLEYHPFLFMLYIPVIAIAGYLTFNKRGYNLPEHIVSATYTLAHLAILTTPFSALTLLFAASKFMIYSFVSIGLMLFFSLYVLVRLHSYPRMEAIGRAALFTILFAIGYFGVSIFMNLLMLALGILEPKDFLPGNG